MQTPDHTLQTAIGSCRDSAWLLVSLLRELGLAARFVSGYLVQLASDVKSLDGPSGPAADFTDLHAWAEVYIPGAGWIGMDPTSGLFAGEGHIPLSATPHPSTAAAITGSTSPCVSTLEYSNVVRRVHEDPRVTLPYTPDQWATIQAVGKEVDQRLTDGRRPADHGRRADVRVDRRRDVRAVDHRRRRPGEAGTVRGAGRSGMKAVYAPQGLLHHGQGKWYPGEPLPRWQIAVHWRAGRRSRCGATRRCWPIPGRRTEKSTAAAAAAVATATPDTAKRFIESVAASFELPASQVRPAFEDPLAELSRNVRLPDGEPVTDDLDPEDDAVDVRAALLARLDSTVTEATAYVLPLHRLPAPVSEDERTRQPKKPPRREHRRRTPRPSAGPAPTGGCVAAGSCC